MAGLIARDPSRPDVRLLLPALAAWAVAVPALVAPSAVVAAAAGAALAVAAGCALAHRRRRGGERGRGVLRALCATGVLVAVVLVAVLGHRGVERAGSVPLLAQERAVVTVVARVTSDPRVVGDRTGRAQTVLLRMTVTEVTGRGAVSRVATPVVAFGDAAWTRVHLHETVRVTGRLGPPRPGDDAVAVLAVRGAPRVVARPGPVDRAAEHVRERFRAATDPLPADARGLVPALVIGDTSRTPADLTDAMRATSLTHLSAVSGSNVSVVLAALLWLCGLVGVPRRARPVVALAGLAGFVVLARPEPSVVRAAVMGAVGLVAVTAGRRRAAMPALGAAVVVLLVLDPWLARSVGFALSALATLGIVVLARPWGEALARHLPAPVAGLGPALAVPLAAQVACAPVTLLLQPGVSVVGVPANLVAEPFVAPATTVGVVAAVFAVVWVPLGACAAWVTAIPALAVAQVARRAAVLPFGTLPWPQGPWGVALLVALTVVGLLTGRRLAWWVRVRPLLAAGLVLVAAAALLPVPAAGWPLPRWTFAACDVGQGDGLALATGPGRAVVVDAGPDGDRLVGCLRRLRVAALDAVVLTHFDADHMSGLSAVLDAYPTARLYGPVVDLPARNAAAVYRAAADHGLAVTRLRAGDRLDVGALHARVLWPQRVLDAGSPQNNASTVLLATVGEGSGATRLLLCADIEREAARVLAGELRAAGGERPDVLKVAHHGSANADPALFAAAAAPLAVISVGARNDYGHPAPRTLTALARAGATVLRTDRCGDTVVQGHGAGLRYACRGP